jgi:hypothetical protein
MFSKRAAKVLLQVLLGEKIKTIAGPVFFYGNQAQNTHD